MNWSSGPVGQVTGDIWYVTHDTWHVTCDTWHMTMFFFLLLFCQFLSLFVLVLLPAHIRIGLEIQCLLSVVRLLGWEFVGFIFWWEENGTTNWIYLYRSRKYILSCLARMSVLPTTKAAVLTNIYSKKSEKYLNS